ncbi:hypothetical protein LTR62_004923 [Meristemomyces frigidus]|uniref:Protein CASP n=1 Tax=Meristemomyces frigidus TaxID=1508187 RepID=A0AAN7YR48_9PEZI|nr:hypothetical protein LTR62_004923 [Meristemomyces frigidus]
MAEALDLPTTAGATDTTDTSGDNKFQQAIAAWRHLSFSTLITTLDTTATDLVTAQQSSLTQRKDLAQKTKDFRKLDDASKLVDIKELLKAYQGYIDLLTKQNGSVREAFMKVYDPLSDVPDPYPLLEASVEALVTADEVMPRLEVENERLKTQVERLEGAVEVAESALVEERNRRSKVEEERDVAVEEVKGRSERVVKEKEADWAEKERGLVSKIEGLEGLVKELKAGFEVEMRLERSGAEGQDAGRGTATQAELDIVNSELDRANVRLVDLETRNESLRTEVARSSGQVQKSGAVEDDPSFLRLRTENQSLLRKLEAARHEKDAEKNSVQTKIRALERDIAALKADRTTLQAKVQKWSDYEEVKRELQMLRAVEFSTSDDIDDDDYERAAKHTNGSAKEGTLENLLITRNKKLTTDLTELRVSHNALLERLEALQAQTTEAQADLARTRKLNARLEEDLEKTQREVGSAWETASVAGTYTSRMPARSAYGSLRRGGGTSPTTSIIGGFDPSAAGSSRGGGGLEAGGAGAGILPMVTAQRDRFKAKLGQLETELQKQYQTVSGLRSEVASLQRDNLDLYEKTRYVSSYATTHRGGAGSGVEYGGRPNPGAVVVGGGADERYKSVYESGLTPFAAFRGRESARAMKRMSLPERAVFQLSRIVLATRTSRNLFAAYCLGLHMLVLIMLFWMGTADAEAHATHLGTVGAAAVGAAGAAGWKEEADGFGAGG